MKIFFECQKCGKSGEDIYFSQIESRIIKVPDLICDPCVDSADNIKTIDVKISNAKYNILEQQFSTYQNKMKERNREPMISSWNDYLLELLRMGIEKMSYFIFDEIYH